MAIVKVLSRHSPSYESLITYILRYVIDEKKTHKERIYTNNLRSNTMAGYVREFIENEAFRRHSRTDQIHLFHEIVSFGADENNDLITPEMIDDLAREYMRLRGDTGVMLGAAHRDKEHVHLHFCVSALHYRTGKSFGLDKRQLQELKQSFQEYHQSRYPELTYSAPHHGSRTRSVSNAHWHHRQRERIVETVRQCLAEAKSQQHFLELLRDHELPHYERKGKASGICYDGTKLRFSRILASDQFEQLPKDTSREDQALFEIQTVRQRQQDRESRTIDIEDKAR